MKISDRHPKALAQSTNYLKADKIRDAACVAFIGNGGSKSVQEEANQQIREAESAKLKPKKGTLENRSYTVTNS
ncbi:MAG: hypothetical protein R3B95_06500 [Nitrospirales bacterium]|nr:hypothetical protein [Nitrospirales bacterium]